jgi:tellurite resistance protein TehB
MSDIWNRAYSADKSFFGEKPSNFAMLCFNHLRINNIKRILELGAGHGRDSIFFASNDIEVEALDYSSVGIGIINNLAKEKKLPIHAQVFDIKKSCLLLMAILMQSIPICFLICAFQWMNFDLYSLTLGEY